MKRRDARIDGRDSGLLKEREKAEEQSFWESVENLSNPVLSGDEDIIVLEEKTQEKQVLKEDTKGTQKQEEKDKKEEKQQEKETKTEDKEKETKTEDREKETKEEPKKQKTKEKTPEQKEQTKNNTEALVGILNEAQTLFARGKIDEAQAAIINGLALKKDHKRLNMLLGRIYEKQKKYDAVEILYKDLAKSHPDDPDIIKSLADVLIIKKKYSVAVALYEKLLTLSKESEEVLFVLSHLTSELEDWENTYRYTRLYQKQWPNNKEILNLEAKSQIQLWKRKEAIETLIKVKNLSPYNADEIQTMIEKLVAEEEMAENFNSQNT